MKEKIKKIKKDVRGITLIALVVTIIVLLILAGVAINLTIGQNGIFTRAEDSTVRYEAASVYEQLQFVIADYQMDDIENNRETEILAKLKSDGYVNSDNTVNIERLMGRSLQTGRGSLEDGDVYVLEQRQSTASSVSSDSNSSLKYYLIYYNDEMAETNLGVAFEANSSTEINLAAGLYETGTENLIKTWDEMIEDGDITVEGTTWTRLNNTTLVGDIVISREITNIGTDDYNLLNSRCGWGYCSITGLYIPNSISEITNLSSFNHVTNIEIEEGVEIIGDRAFYRCSALKQIDIPNSVKRIGWSAFSESGLQEIVIPENVEVIENEAFSFCEDLERVQIQGELKYIGRIAFYNTNLTTLYIPGSVVIIEVHNYDETIVDDGVVLYFGHDSKPEGWSDLYNESETCKYGYTYEEYEAEISNL